MNAMAEHDVDLFVIGGGSGGVRAARIAAGHGARVMVAEEYRLGGTCVIRGCVPKKLLVYASRFHGEFADAAGFGWTVSQASFDWTTLIANKDREIARLEAAYGATLAKAGAKVVKTRAVLADAHTRATGERRTGAGGAYLDRDGRCAELRRPHPRHRTRDYLQRGVPPDGISAPRGDPGRRLYRRRIRRHLRRPRFACDARLSRREYLARLRRRRASASARRDGGARHQSDHRVQDRGDRTSRAALLGSAIERQSCHRRPGHVRDRPASQYRQARSEGGGRRDRQEWRHRGRRLFAHQRAEHLCGRRRHQSYQFDAGRHSRRPCLRRHRVRRQSGQSRSCQCADGGVLGARDRRRRADRDARRGSGWSGPISTRPCSGR